MFKLFENCNVNPEGQARPYRGALSVKWYPSGSLTSGLPCRASRGSPRGVRAAGREPGAGRRGKPGGGRGAGSGPGGGRPRRGRGRARGRTSARSRPLAGGGAAAAPLPGRAE